jgi:chromosome segregation ATPase
LQIPSYNDAVLSPTLSLELSWTTSGDESPRDDDSYQSLNSKGRDSRYQDQDSSRLTADIETLLTQKLDLTDKHIKLSDQVELKEFQLSQLDQDLVRQKSELQEEVEKQHRKRNELEQEVRQMKLRIHLLSSDLKDESTGPQNFSSILRSLSADHSEHSQGDVEMHTMRESSNGMNLTPERLTYLESVEKLLDEEKSQRSQLESRCHSLEHEIKSSVIEKERLAYLETVEVSLTSEEARRSQLETRCLSLEKEMESNLLAQGQLDHFESVEFELTEERTRRNKLESRCQSLEQELKSIAEHKEQSAHLKLAQDRLNEEKDQLNQLETAEQEIKSIASDNERLAHLEFVGKLLNDERAQRSQLESRCQLLEQEVKSSAITKDQELDRLDSVEKHLTEEKCLRSQLETRYQSLDHELKSTVQEKGELSLQKETLLAEIQSLKAEIDTIREQATDADSNEEPSSPCETEKTESSQDQKGGGLIVKTTSAEKREKIRSHAEQMLSWADQAIGKRRGSMQSVCSSVASSVGTEFRPTPAQPAPAVRAPQPSAALKSGKPPKIPPRPKPQGEQQIVISNLENMDQIAGCTCETSAFSGNTEHVEFYLPKLGVACSCGKRKEPELAEGVNPCALEHILRPWQADFLASLGIKEAVDFVHAYNNRGNALAKDMRRWRRVKCLVSIKTKSCSIALHIWSRTCRSVVKAVQVQKANGVERLRRPDFMDVTIASDSCSVSTLGLGSHAGL